MSIWDYIFHLGKENWIFSGCVTLFIGFLASKALSLIPFVNRKMIRYMDNEARKQGTALRAHAAITDYYTLLHVFFILVLLWFGMGFYALYNGDVSENFHTLHDSLALALLAWTVALPVKKGIINRILDNHDAMQTTDESTAPPSAQENT